MSKSSQNSAFSKGDAILSEKPFVHVLKSSMSSERCDHCFEKGELVTCSECKQIRYCDRICQKKGWSLHKRECRNIKRIAPKILPDSARMLARIIFKLDKGGAREQAFYSPRQFRVFMDLMSHYNELKEDAKRMEHFEALYPVLADFFGDECLPNPIELLRIFGKMIINTFCILDGEMQVIGTGLYLGASILDHSCDPNAVAVFEGTTLHIRTLVDVAQIDWGKVSISYIDGMKLTEERQKELQDSYYFLCQCRRCLDVEELDLMTATVCQECGDTVPGGARIIGAKCVKCEKPVTAPLWEKIVNVTEFTKEQLQQMKNIAYLDVCRLCIRQQQGLLDPMNIRHVQTIDMAMDSEMCMELWEAALNHGRYLIKPFRKYYGDSHPLTGILYAKLGRIAFYLNMIPEARKHFIEAVKILAITHGPQHNFVREEIFTYLRQCNNN